MSNWDLMMPGMGLTSIGLAGVVISYSGIAHTFIDGMHALTGLTMFIGLIFLAAGILQGGVSTSNKAKATVLVILSISLAFGTAGLIFNTISTVPLFAGIMMIIAVPAIVIAYVSTKMPAYARPMSIIFVLAAVAGISSYTAFGYIGPSPYLVEEPVIVEPEIIVPQGPSFVISILVGSAEQGNPDYEPDDAVVPLGEIIKWSNDDDVVHTVTSTDDVGESFDSGLIAPGDEYLLDPSTLESKASTNIIDMGRAYAGIFVDTYAMTIAGTAIIIMMPAKSGTVLMVLNINPAVPNANDIESMTKTVAFALLLVDTPPCNIPAAKKISPMNMVSPVRACMPSMNV